MKYLIERDTEDFVAGVKIQTRGNDDEYPTFELEDGTKLGVHESRVIGRIKED